MSGKTDTAVVGRVRSIPGRTLVAIRGTLARRDGRIALAVTTVVYLALFEVGTGHLGLGDGDIALSVVADPLARVTRRIAPFQYEPVAFLSVGPVEYLFAPVTAAVGLGLGLLVGLNLAVSLVAWRGPSACRVRPGTGLVAGLPGLVSGVACCGPTILLVVGVQASAGLLALFRWLVPAAAALLILSLLWVGSRVERTGG